MASASASALSVALLGDVLFASIQRCGVGGHRFSAKVQVLVIRDGVTSVQIGPGRALDQRRSFNQLNVAESRRSYSLVRDPGAFTSGPRTQRLRPNASTSFRGSNRRGRVRMKRHSRDCDSLCTLRLPAVPIPTRLRSQFRLPACSNCSIHRAIPKITR